MNKTENKKLYIGLYTDEYLSYYKLYGELIYCVPHYFKSYKENEDGSRHCEYPNGGSTNVYPIKRFVNI